MTPQQAAQIVIELVLKEADAHSAKYAGMDQRESIRFAANAALAAFNKKFPSKD